MKGGRWRDSSGDREDSKGTAMERRQRMGSGEVRGYKALGGGVGDVETVNVTSASTSRLVY